jgi:hypothetical protein
MGVSPKSAFQSLTRGLASVLFAIAGLSFFFGGRAISELGKMDRLLAEMLGFALAAVCVGLGFLAKTVGEPDDDEEGGASPP